MHNPTSWMSSSSDISPIAVLRHCYSVVRSPFVRSPFVRSSFRPPQMSEPPNEQMAGVTPMPVKLSLDERFNDAQLVVLEANKEKYRVAGRAARKELVQATLEQFVTMLERMEEVVNQHKRVAIREVSVFSVSYSQYRTDGGVSPARRISPFGTLNELALATNPPLASLTGLLAASSTERTLNWLPAPRKPCTRRKPAKRVIRTPFRPSSSKRSRRGHPSLHRPKKRKLLSISSNPPSLKNGRGLGLKGRQSMKLGQSSGGRRDPRLRRRDGQSLSLPQSILFLISPAPYSLAESDANRLMHQFALDLYRQMDVRMMIFASYFDTNGHLQVGEGYNLVLKTVLLIILHSDPRFQQGVWGWCFVQEG